MNRKTIDLRTNDSLSIKLTQTVPTHSLAAVVSLHAFSLQFH